jgi:hypothetical protein
MRSINVSVGQQFMVVATTAQRCQDLQRHPVEQVPFYALGPEQTCPVCAALRDGYHHFKAAFSGM